MSGIVPRVLFHVLGWAGLRHKVLPRSFCGHVKNALGCVSVAVALQPMDVRWLQGEKNRLRQQKNRVNGLMC